MMALYVDKTMANFIATVYRKPTHWERYLVFDSHHAVLYKSAAVKSLSDRAKNVPS